MLNIAIIGLGWWGLTHLRFMQESKRVKAIIGFDPDAQARAAAEKAGLKTIQSFEAILADPNVDAVLLCTPHAGHVREITAAAKAGKHVFCEKPLGIDPIQAESAFEAVQQAGVVLGIGHERRFEPAMMEMLARARAGEFGELLAIEGNFSQDLFLKLPADNWRLSPIHAPVGPLSATGIHLVDLSIAFLGQPHETWARLSTRASHFGNGDTLSITLGYENGATASITAILTTPFAGRFALYGSKGWFEIRDRSHPQQPTGWDVTRVMSGADPITRFDPPHPSVLGNIEAFAKAVAGEEKYPVSIDEMRANVKAFAAVSRSALSGKIERL